MLTGCFWIINSWVRPLIIMLVTYPAKYHDRFGDEATTVENDGTMLRMVVRGIEFTGRMFDDWEPSTPIPHLQPANFPLNRGELCSYALDCEIPIAFVKANQTTQATLRMHLELGEPSANGGVDREELKLKLVIAEQPFESSGQHGFFEDALKDLQAKLPADAYLKCCFTCAFSDYSPAGQGLFGALICFRYHKQEYQSFTDKPAFFRLIEKTRERVQETYLCPEFEKRVPGTGYRG
jgi:hypothetical protein